MPKPYELQLEDYWRIIRRHQLLIIATCVIITGAIFFNSSKRPILYQASSSIQIDEEEALEHPRMGWMDFIETQLHVIRSSEVAYEAAVHAGEIREGMTQTEIDRAVAQFVGVSANNRERTGIVDIRFTSPLPEEASRVVNAVAHGYQTWSVKHRAEEARQVRQFVEQQLKETGEKLSAEEEALKTFKEKTPIGASVANYQNELINLELRLSNLLERFTARHPEVMELHSQIQALKEKLASFPKAELEYNRLERSITELKTIYSSLKNKYENARTDEAKNVSGVAILNLAAVPRSPIPLNIGQTTATGGLIGLILGVLLAFVKENVNTSISTIEEVEDFLQVPILGVIPEMTVAELPEKQSVWKRWLRFLPFKAFRIATGGDTTNIEDVRKLLMLHHDEEHTTAREAYKTLRTDILFATSDKKGQILGITSAGVREGKTLTSLNLALTLAQSGHKTCLVSADLRREVISRLLGVHKEPGLANILTKEKHWKEVLRKTTDLLFGELKAEQIIQTLGIDNFYFITSGRTPPNPAELLSLSTMDDLLAELRAAFDFVIVDAPPVLPVSDPSILAPKMDGVIIIYHAGKMARGALRRAKIQLTNAGAKILGVVLNNIKAAEMKMSPSYYYYYKGYYAEEKGVTRLPKKEKHWWQKIFSKAA